MQWESRYFNSIYDAVNANTNGKADEMLNVKPGYVHVQNMDVMASWIKAYTSKMPNIPITIFGDYDADGICSSAELYLLLSYLGATNVRVRLPKRLSEGYGMSEKAVDEISSGIIITVDNGIAALKAIQKAKDKGLIVLVIDHHMPVMENNTVVLPCADLIVDPHVSDELIAKGSVKESGFRDYCGAGLVYKLCELLVKDQAFIGNMAAFACIATIADVVPLLGDNRRIYRNGIWAIKNRYMTPGLQAIVDVLMADNNVSEGDIGFTIAPMLNAPGRLYDDGANISLETVLCTDFLKARTMVERLKMINNERKTARNDAVERAYKQIEERCLFATNPIVIYDENIPEGIVGLVASAISEDFNVSSFVFTKKGDSLKGSARGCEADNIKASLDVLNGSNPEIFAGGYGGHPGAAGLSIKEEYLDLFEEKMTEILSEPQGKPDVITYDMEIPSGKLQETVSELQKYVPFGEGNPSLIFKVDNFQLVPMNNAFYSKMGKNAIRFYGAGCEAIGFSHASKYENSKCPMEMNLVGKLGFHYFMGKVTPQIEILDFEPVEQKRESSDLTDSIANAFNMTGIKVNY